MRPPRRSTCRPRTSARALKAGKCLKDLATTQRSTTRPSARPPRGRQGGPRQGGRGRDDQAGARGPRPGPADQGPRRRAAAPGRHAGRLTHDCTETGAVGTIRRSRLRYATVPRPIPLTADRHLIDGTGVQPLGRGPRIGPSPDHPFIPALSTRTMTATRRHLSAFAASALTASLPLTAASVARRRPARPCPSGFRDEVVGTPASTARCRRVRARTATSSWPRSAAVI